MELKTTDRGFTYFEFTDRYDHECSLQKSSLATEDAIWLGINDAEPKILIKGCGWQPYPLHEDVMLTTRMHLTREMVAELLPHLHRFVDTGEVGDSH